MYINVFSDSVTAYPAGPTDSGLEGIELTSAVLVTTLAGRHPHDRGSLFAFSTSLAWSYYVTLVVSVSVPRA